MSKIFLEAVVVLTLANLLLFFTYRYYSPLSLLYTICLVSILAIFDLARSQRRK